MTSFSRVLLAISLSDLSLCAYAEHPEENDARVPQPPTRHQAFEQAVNRRFFE